MNPDHLSGQGRTESPEIRTDNHPPLGGSVRSPVRGVEKKSGGDDGDGDEPHAPASGAPVIAPRLLNLRQMAEYLGCSYWTARDWVLAGLIPVFVPPPLRPREGDPGRTTLRRVLVDRVDLDAFIESRKRTDVQSAAPRIAPVNTGRSRRSVPALCPPEGR